MRTSLLALLLLASTASAADMPRYWSVHIDIPSDRAAFERIDREFSEAQKEFYAEHDAQRPPVTIFSTSDGAYYALRARGAFSDFDKPSALGSDAAKALQAKLAPISAATHEVLRDHHSEIWMLDSKRTHVAGSSAPKYIVLRTDRVRPPDEDKYNDEMKTLCDQLIARGVRILAFFSAYGDGAYHYVFMFDEPLRIRTLGSIAKTTDVTAVARPDLAVADVTQWLVY